MTKPNGISNGFARERLDISRIAAIAKPNGPNGPKATPQARATKPKESDDESEPLSPNLWPEPVDGNELVRDLCDTLFRHIVMTEAQEMAVALWIIHAHAHAACRRSPILALTAPTHGCGKTLLLEVVGYLVPRPFTTDNATPAKLCRQTSTGKTILADECETWMHEAKADGMRGLLNSSWRRGGTWDRVNATYSTWAPFCIALNGHLHATTESRSIIIRLHRKPKGKKVAPLREPDPDDAKHPFNILRRKAARWAFDNLATLKSADPRLPPELGNRNADNCKPLLAIADATGWPKKARESLLAILGNNLQELSLGEQLMTDIELVFQNFGSPLTSAQLCAQLNEIETSPWATYHRGAALNPIKLAALLKDFEIKPGEINIGRRATGYKLAQFVKAFKNYGSRP